MKASNQPAVKRMIPDNMYTAISLIAAIALWVCISSTKAHIVFARPGEVFAALKEMFGSGKLIVNITASLYRSLTGFSLAFVCALPVAFLMGWYRPCRLIFEPWVKFIKSIPPIACWDVHATNVIDNVGIDNLEIIASTGQFSDQTAFPASWTATPEYIEKNHDVVIRFIKALNQCYDYRDTHLDESIKSAAEFGGVDYETFNKTRNDAQNFTPVQLEKMLDNGELKVIYQLQLDYLIKDGKVKEGNVDKYVRTDLMKEAFGK